MIKTLRRETFEPHVGTKFTIVPGDGSREETVLAVVFSLGAAYLPDGREPFSLVFKAATRRVLPQRIYRLEHSVMPEMDVFLVPIQPDADGQRYEAVFT
jgi:hypothetical protein